MVLPFRPRRILPCFKMQPCLQRLFGTFWLPHVVLTLLTTLVTSSMSQQYSYHNYQPKQPEGYYSGVRSDGDYAGHSYQEPSYHGYPLAPEATGVSPAAHDLSPNRPYPEQPHHLAKYADQRTGNYLSYQQFSHSPSSSPYEVSKPEHDDTVLAMDHYHREPEPGPSYDPHYSYSHQPAYPPAPPAHYHPEVLQSVQDEAPARYPASSRPKEDYGPYEPEPLAYHQQLQPYQEQPYQQYHQHQPAYPHPEPAAASHHQVEHEVAQSHEADVAHELSTPETPKYLGTFKNSRNKVEGDIFMLDEKTLYIQGFSFDGEAPDVYFWSEGTAIPYYTRSDPRVQLLVGEYRNEDLVLMLPPAKLTMDNLKQFSIWCKKFDVTFGEFHM